MQRLNILVIASLWKHHCSWFAHAWSFRPSFVLGWQFQLLKVLVWLCGTLYFNGSSFFAAFLKYGLGSFLLWIFVGDKGLFMLKENVFPTDLARGKHNKLISNAQLYFALLLWWREEKWHQKDILLSFAFPQRKYDVILDFSVRFSSSSTSVQEEMFLKEGRQYV